MASRLISFFGDERCVPRTSLPATTPWRMRPLISEGADSGKGMFTACWQGNRTRMRGHTKPVANLLRRTNLAAFDLVLLGMGEDGHTASLFPDQQRLKEMSRWVVATGTSSLARTHYATVPVFKHARRIMVLVTGKKKGATPQRMLRPQPGFEAVAGSRNYPIEGMLNGWWMLTQLRSCSTQR